MDEQKKGVCSRISASWSNPYQCCDESMSTIKTALLEVQDYIQKKNYNKELINEFYDELIKVAYDFKVDKLKGDEK